MQNTSTPSRPIATYRERLSPSLWLLGGAAVVAPMAALVFVQIDRALSLAIGVVVAVAVIAVLVGSAPVVEVRGTTLRAGRAHIDASYLGEPIPLTGEQARTARGRDLDPHGWYLIRGGIDGLVVVPNTDGDDPVTSWTISTRTPDRLAAAIAHARRAS
ncbi:DUF3093 family protein [Microbacterium sediminis]|uniref:Uncharacterized protein n=1 Tax=Microbacterium sediminis TaxID=904291 RepID=A0A1B9NFJ5_9MICO|nr:DUF3093 family protein [Microbacterium sediminis]OCG75391.1 hypothetical protein A7J15_03145 [Microbacterium sediminis]QBR74416.1 DUF3093 domain-containing protein [Microbacterium sediminis]